MRNGRGGAALAGAIILVIAAAAPGGAGPADYQGPAQARTYRTPPPGQGNLRAYSPCTTAPNLRRCR